MAFTAVRASFGDIEPLRRSFLEESQFQIRYDACHQRGWADHYVLMHDGSAVGYGAIKGQEIADRDTVFEFFLNPDHRRHAAAAFRALLGAAQPAWIECQSNDFPLFSMLCCFARGIAADTILFEDHAQTTLSVPDTLFRRKQTGEPIFTHHSEPLGDYVLERGGRVVATGGYFTHYNMPFADLYMEVDADHRGRGLAPFLLQEIKAACRRDGRVPAARCNVDNEASRAALCKAGMRVCGFMLKGAVG